MADEVTTQPAEAGPAAEPTDREQLAEQIAKALREAELECDVVVMPPTN